ncbi:MAG: cupin domain-containing protein [Calditrichia bacterium]
MAGFKKQTNPFIVPTTDGKLIEEHFGMASTGSSQCSVAHMIAPPGWSEPYQKPEFDEFTIMISGTKIIEFNDEIVELKAGETLLVNAGTRLRYSNPYEEPAEYWSFCIPAFSPDTVHRED